MTVTFVVPDDDGLPSGGHTYNRAVLAAWRAAGRPVRTVMLPGPWPDADARTQARLAAVARTPGPVLVDGLVGCAHPEAIAGAHLLIHLPLPDEGGLSRARADALAALEHRAVHAAAGVIATSHAAAADLHARYGRPVAVAAPGVDPAPTARGSDPPLLLALAALTPRKNHATLIAALARLTRRPWRAAVVGPAPDPTHLADLRAAADAAGIADRLAWPGACTGSALERWWQAADLLVLPSLAETYGLVVTEAAARGVPAVVAAGTGAEEALGDSGAGRAVDARDPDAFAAALGAWLDEPDLRRRWRRAAAARRATLRPWADTADDLWRLLA